MEHTKSIKTCMIGCGKLGLPCAEVMSEYYEVFGYDINPISTNSNIKIKSSIFEAIYNRDIIFIAVPTPHDYRYDGSAPISNLEPKDFDYSIVESVLSEIVKHITDNQLIVLISTVLPGTTRSRFENIFKNKKFIYNPYLIAMGSVKWDMVNPECIIIGTKNGNITSEAQLLIDFYKPLMKNNPRINIGTWDEAESIKIFYNTFISAKLGLVNMIQDIAEKNGNINVDVVTDALKYATQRITGPKYLTAGIGDGGSCHPRDNIALRYLANKLDLGYDLFHAIMSSRDIQAKNIALRLIELSKKYDLPIVIHGKSYKPYVSYTEGSYSLLIGHFIEQEGYEIAYADPLTGDFWAGRAVILMAHNPGVTYKNTGVEIKPEQYYFYIEPGSIILDPWRTLTKIEGSIVIPYGNTRLNETF